MAVTRIIGPGALTGRGSIHRRRGQGTRGGGAADRDQDVPLDRRTVVTTITGVDGHDAGFVTDMGDRTRGPWLGTVDQVELRERLRDT
jgi:hypothetical protein